MTELELFFPPLLSFQRQNGQICSHKNQRHDVLFITLSFPAVGTSHEQVIKRCSSKRGARYLHENNDTLSSVFCHEKPVDYLQRDIQLAQQLTLQPKGENINFFWKFLSIKSKYFSDAKPHLTYSWHGFYNELFIPPLFLNGIFSIFKNSISVRSFQTE